MTRCRVRLLVNGRWRTGVAGSRTTLLELLREQLNLTGVKNGCGEGHCGACTVLLDGRPVRSCVTLVQAAEGHTVLTIEGLAQDGRLHPLQQAFVDMGAIQCGFCTPGMVLSAKALLGRQPDPSAADIKRALRSNLCRCTGYTSIVEAVQAAAAVLRGERAFEPVCASGVGVGLPSPDAVAKVTGAAVFADDQRFDGMLHAAVRRADRAPAHVGALDIAVAARRRGVQAVLAAGSLPAHTTHGVLRDDWPILTGGLARYEGDALALVAANTRNQAESAARAIPVALSVAAGVHDAATALEPGAPKVHPGGNLCSRTEIRRGDVDSAMAGAAVVVEREYSTAACEHAFLEPETSIAVPEPDGSMIVYAGSQIPFGDRRQVAAALGVSESRVRVVHTKVGGAFGGKEDIAGQIHAALLAQATGRPVKLRFSRRESIRVHPKRHALVMRVVTAAEADGRLLAVRVRILGDTGAYASLGPAVMTRAASHVGGAYVVPNVDIESSAVYTNNPPAGAFRGFGAPQALFAAESQMDILARELGLSPVEIRRRNLLRVGSVNAAGQRLRDSVGLEETLERAIEAAGPDGRARLERPWAGPCVEGDQAVGWGIACGFKNVGLGQGLPDGAGAEVELLGDGTVEVRAGAAEVGQGLDGVVSQIVQQVLGVSPGRVRVVLGDTARTLDGGATTASRQTFVTGNAARLAAQDLRRQMEAMIEPQAAKSADMAWDRLVERVGLRRASGHRFVGQCHYTPPSTVTFGQEGDIHFAYGYATQIAQVQVQVSTGVVRVLRVIAAHDVGRAINPMAVRGQIQGGVVMGVGVGLFEELQIEHGHIVNDSFASYRIPRTTDVPEITPIIVEAPTREGPFGAKGVGEISSMLTPVAITNAIRDACGADVRDLPASPARVMAALSSGAALGGGVLPGSGGRSSAARDRT